jgi:hypothetical protein
METSLLAVLQTEQDYVRKINDYKAECDYRLSLETLTEEQQLDLQWFKTRLDGYRESLPHVRAQIKIKIMEYIK